jgi:hypothetical protein
MQTIDYISLKKHLDEDAVILEGLDDCIMGVCNNNRLIYGYGQLMKHFLFEGMSHSKAIKYIDYNIVRLLNKGKGFTIMYELEYML